MREPILFPDAAAVVCEHLRDSTGLPTDNKVPNPRPTEFYVVQRVGGPRRELVLDDATLVVESWAQTSEAASDNAEEARAYLSALCSDFVGDALVYRVVEVAGPAELPDPLSDQSRVTFTVQVTLRGSALVGS